MDFSTAEVQSMLDRTVEVVMDSEDRDGVVFTKFFVNNKRSKIESDSESDSESSGSEDSDSECPEISDEKKELLRTELSNHLDVSLAIFESMEVIRIRTENDCVHHLIPTMTKIHSLFERYSEESHDNYFDIQAIAFEKIYMLRNNLRHKTWKDLISDPVLHKSMEAWIDFLYDLVTDSVALSFLSPLQLAVNSVMYRLLEDAQRAWANSPSRLATKRRPLTAEEEEDIISC
jgi:hypothetical protein